MLSVLLCLALTAAQGAGAPVPAPSLDLRGPLAEALRPVVIDELGVERIATSSASATLTCHLARAEDTLLLQTTRSGTSVLRRVEIVDGDLDAALRVVVVLIERALAPPSDPGPEPDPDPELAPGMSPRTDDIVERAPIPEAVDPWNLELTGGLAMTLWTSPLTPRLGPGLAAQLRWGSWRFGAFTEVLGVGCCTARGDIELEATSLLVGLRVDRILLESGPWSLAAYANAGLRIVDGTARSTVYAAAGTPEPVTLRQGLVGVGAEVERRLWGPAALAAQAGLSLFIGDHEISLPSAFSGTNDRLSMGRVAPWFGLAVRVEVL